MRKMEKINFNRVAEMYLSGMSTHAIAEVFDTYPNKIRRLLLQNGFELRSKSDAQSLAISSGRTKHPTKGTKRTAEERMKISKRLCETWENMPPEEKSRRSEIARKNYHALTEEQKEDMQRKGLRAVCEASRKGSKAELFLLDYLQSRGYDVILHDKDLLEGSFECDLHLPELKVVIEIDGKKHREAWFGQEQLDMGIAFDNKKDKLLTDMDYTLIRIKYTLKNASLYKHNTMSENVHSLITKIENDMESFSGKILHQEI